MKQLTSSVFPFDSAYTKSPLPGCRKCSYYPVKEILDMKKKNEEQASSMGQRREKMDFSLKWGSRERQRMSSVFSPLVFSTSNAKSSGKSERGKKKKKGEQADRVSSSRGGIRRLCRDYYCPASQRTASRTVQKQEINIRYVSLPIPSDTLAMKTRILFLERGCHH